MIKRAGKVWLVGAGPGDVSLITVKGLQCIKQADVLVYDRLVNPELLAMRHAGCELMNVGKHSGHHPIPQEEINQILVEQAKAGKWVVRLKCGDPYVFGRGGEEAESLIDEGIAFEVVPGVTSAIGGLSYAGIPVTHRDYASSFHVVTGHVRTDKEKPDVNWQALAQLDGTLVILMGIANLANIVHQLIYYGKDENTPVAIIVRASWDNQQLVIGSLKDIVQQTEEQHIKPPALIVIGEVVKLHQHLNFAPYLTSMMESVSYEKSPVNC